MFQRFFQVFGHQARRFLQPIRGRYEQEKQRGMGAKDEEKARKILLRWLLMFCKQIKFRWKRFYFSANDEYGDFYFVTHCIHRGSKDEVFECTMAMRSHH